jgi:prepilin-type N-terminal cleavage/methylation domain-containing protein
LKKGITLIELIIALFIGSVIVIIELSLFSSSIKDYRESIINDREEIYSREALRFVESEIVDVKNKFIKVRNDELILKKTSGDINIIKEVSKSNGQSKIVVEYDKVTTSINTTDTILEGIKEFKVKGVDNLIYVEIHTDNGDRYERCFGSNKVEKAIL